jgi:hypothetical protein
MVNVVPLFGDERKIYRPFETYLDYIRSDASGIYPLS